MGKCVTEGVTLCTTGTYPCWGPTRDRNTPLSYPLQE